MSVLLLPFPTGRLLADALARETGFAIGALAWRKFPDGESLVAVDEAVSGADVAIVCSLRDPDAQALALRYAAATARELGARSVGLIAPYLAYMRQDRRFHAGEAVSAPLFARFLQESFDWLLTVDPHLHRIARLDQVFAIPAVNVPAAPAIAEWISREVPDALLIGPDSESAQWVAEIAQRARVMHQVLEKQRFGDRDVRVSLPDAAASVGRQPVIVDDIASSGQTIAETVRQLTLQGMAAPIVVVIHAVFAEGAQGRIEQAGAARLVSCDTIPHDTNAIPMTAQIAPQLRAMLTRIADSRTPESLDATGLPISSRSTSQ